VEIWSSYREWPASADKINTPQELVVNDKRDIKEGRTFIGSVKIV
jgi:hypothetical protein